MSLRRQLRRLEDGLRGTLESFVLEDGSRHYYDPASGELFLHSVACLRVQGEGKTTFPEPPATIKFLTRARDRRAALDQVAGGLFPYDERALVERGELVPRPRSIVAGRELGEPLEDLSEP